MSEGMDKVFDGYKDILEKKGFRVAINTEFCKIYKTTHENCFGCESEDGCHRYVKIIGIQAESLMYKPNSYD